MVLLEAQSSIPCTFYGVGRTTGGTDPRRTTLLGSTDGCVAGDHVELLILERSD